MRILSRALLAAVVLALALAGPAVAQDLTAARTVSLLSAVRVVADGHARARDAAGPEIAVKWRRALRATAVPSTASDADLAALAAEAAARGRGETTADLAAHHLARWQAYVAARAAIDGHRAAAVAAIHDATTVAAINAAVAALSAGVAAAVASIPAP